MYSEALETLNLQVSESLVTPGIFSGESIPARHSVGTYSYGSLAGEFGPPSHACVEPISCFCIDNDRCYCHHATQILLMHVL